MPTNPTTQPSSEPSGLPSGEPSSIPSGCPTTDPSAIPSGKPSISPSGMPSGAPSLQPSGAPTRCPSGKPSKDPTSQPSVCPTNIPTGIPTSMPTEFLGILSDAYFSSNGCSVSVIFNVTTNRGGFGGETFLCSFLFEFLGVQNSLCRWEQDDVVIINFSGNSKMLPGSSIWLKDKIVKESCFPPSTCNDGVYAQRDRVVLRAPSEVLQPKVVISAPENVGSCANVTVDLSSSYGSGCREWSNATIELTDIIQVDIQRLLTKFAAKKMSIFVIPRSMLASGINYTYYVQLCNFLGRCDKAYATIRVSDENFPTLTFAGGSNRFFPTSSALNLEASVSMCGSTVEVVSVVLSWQIYSSSGDLLPIKSKSMLPNRFSALPYTFSPGKTYYGRILAHTEDNKNEAQSSIRPVSALVTLNVLHSQKITAIISGGAEQTAHVSENYWLDGSSSCDNDFADCGSYGLNFSWVCETVAQFGFEQCILSENIEWNKPTLMLPGSFLSVAQNLFITLKVSKIQFGRVISDQYHANIRVVDTDFPIVVLSGPSVLRREDKLTIGCQLKITKGIVTASWSAFQNRIANAPLALSTVAISKTLYTFTSLEGLASLSAPLILPSGVLFSASSYTFMIKCELSDGRSLSTSITLQTISPPLPGLFQSNPKEGIAFYTMFMLAASQWFSDSLPLSYKFGVIISKTEVALGSKSGMSYMTNSFAAGLSSQNYHVNVTVTVYDSFNSSNGAWELIAVAPAPRAVTDAVMNSAIALQVTSSNTDEISRGILVVTSLLNIDICELAPNCADLNRFPCSSIKSTCGRCFDGFYGDNDNAEGNSVCLSPVFKEFPCAVFEYFPSGLTCEFNSHCPRWEVCRSRKCIRPVKPCLNDCSGHGTCGFYKTSSIFTAYSSGACYTGDVDCVTRCICELDYIGQSCLFKAADLQLKRQHRTLALWLLLNVSIVSDIDFSLIISTASTLYSLTVVVDEISPDSAVVISKIIDFLLAESLNNKLPVSRIADDIMSAIDMAILATSDYLNSFEMLQNNLNTFASVNAQQTNVLENPFSLIKRTFAFTSSSVLSFSGLSNSFDLDNDQNVTVLFPRRVHKCVESNSPNMLSFSLDSGYLATDIRLTMLIIFTKYLSFLESDTDLIKVSFTAGTNALSGHWLENSSGLPTELNFDLFNRDEILHINKTLKSSFLYTFKTICGYREMQVYDYTCPRTGFVIHHVCNDSAGTMVTRCPTQRYTSYPSCGGWNGTHNADNGCVVIKYSAISTTCRCFFDRIHEGSRRLQASNISTIASLALVTMTSFSFDFGAIPKTTFVPVDHAYDGLSYVQIGIFPVMIALYYVLALTLVLFIFQYCLMKATIVPSSEFPVTIAASVGDREMAERISENCMHQWNNFAKTGTHRQLLSAFIDDCFLNHRWLRILKFESNHGIKNFNFNIYTRNIALLAINFLTVLVSVILACVLVDDDDTFCEQFADVEECLKPSRYFVEFERKCRWEKAGLCNPEEYTNSPFTILCVSLMALFVIYPVNGCLNLLVSCTCAVSFGEHKDIKLNGDIEMPDKSHWFYKRRGYDDDLAARITAGVHLDSLKCSVLIELSKICNDSDKNNFMNIWGDGNYSVPPLFRNGIMKYFSYFMSQQDEKRLSRLFYRDLLRSYKLSRTCQRQFNVIRLYSGNIQKTSPFFESMVDIKVIQLLTLDLLPNNEELILKAKFERDSNEWIILDRWKIWISYALVILYGFATVIGICFFLHFRRLPVLILWFYASLVCIFSDFVLIQTAVIFFRDSLSMFLIFPALRIVRTSIIAAIINLNNADFSPLTTTMFGSLTYGASSRAFVPCKSADESRPAESVSLQLSEKRNVKLIEQTVGKLFDPAEIIGMPFFSSVRLAVSLKDSGSRSLEMLHKFATRLPRSHMFELLKGDKYYELHEHDIAVGYKNADIKKRIANGLIIAMSFFASLPIFLQDIAYETFVALFWFQVVLIHLNLYRAGASLVFLPLLFIGALVILFFFTQSIRILSTRYALHRSKHAVSVSPSEAVELNMVGATSDPVEYNDDSHGVFKHIDQNDGEKIDLASAEENIVFPSFDEEATIFVEDGADVDFMDGEFDRDSDNLDTISRFKVLVEDHLSSDNETDYIDKFLVKSADSSKEEFWLNNYDLKSEDDSHISTSSLGKDDSTVFPTEFHFNSSESIEVRQVHQLDIIDRLKILEAISAKIGTDGLSYELLKNQNSESNLMSTTNNLDGGMISEIQRIMSDSSSFIQENIEEIDEMSNNSGGGLIKRFNDLIDKSDLAESLSDTKLQFAFVVKDTHSVLSDSTIAESDADQDANIQSTLTGSSKGSKADLSHNFDILRDLQSMFETELSPSRAKKSPNLSSIMATADFFAGAADEIDTMIADKAIFEQSSDTSSRDDALGDITSLLEGDSLEEESSDKESDNNNISESSDSNEFSADSASNFDVSLATDEDYSMLKSLHTKFYESDEAISNEEHYNIKSDKSNILYSSILGELDSLFSGTKDEAPIDHTRHFGNEELEEGMWEDLEDILANTELEKKFKTINEDKEADLNYINQDKPLSLPSISSRSVEVAQSFRELSSMIESSLVKKKKRKKAISDISAGEDFNESGQPKNEELINIKLSHQRHEAGRKTEIRHAQMSARASLVNRLDEKMNKKRDKRNSRLITIGENGAIESETLRRTSMNRRRSQMTSIPTEIVLNLDMSETPSLVENKSKISKQAIDSPFQKVIVDHAKTTAMLEEEMKQKKSKARQKLLARRRAKMAAISAGSSDGTEGEIEDDTQNNLLSLTAPQNDNAERITDDFEDKIESKSNDKEKLSKVLTHEYAGHAEVAMINAEKTDCDAKLTDISILDKIDAILTNNSSQHNDNGAAKSYYKEKEPFSRTNSDQNFVDIIRDDFAMGRDVRDDGAFKQDYFKRVSMPSPDFNEPDSALSGFSMHSYGSREEAALDHGIASDNLLDWNSESESDVFGGDTLSPSIARPSFIDWGTVDEVAVEADMRMQSHVVIDRYAGGGMIWEDYFPDDSEFEIEEA